MATSEKPGELSPIARWILVLPAACLSALAATLFFAFLIFGFFPVFFKMYGSWFTSGSMVAGFVYGGAMIAPKRHWIVCAFLTGVAFIIFVSLGFPMNRLDLLQGVVGGFFGTGLVGFSVWYAPKLKRVRAKNIAQNEQIAAYLKNRRSEGMSLPALAWLSFKITFPFKFLKLPIDAPRWDHSNPFGLNRD